MEILNLPSGLAFSDERGKLSALEFSTLPFEPRRFYWIYEVPEQVTRGGHAHKRLTQFIFALSGSFMIAIENGTERFELSLEASKGGVILPPALWREMFSFSKNCVMGVLADRQYEEDDYIFDKDQYLLWKREEQ